jgi:hypothetical protein
MQKKLFSIGQQDLGDGQVLCQWSPRATWLAAAGNKVCTSRCKMDMIAYTWRQMQTVSCNLQRVVVIYDHTGKLYSEIHLAPRELPAADLHQCCCLQLQVGTATYNGFVGHALQTA